MYTTLCCMSSYLGVELFFFIKVKLYISGDDSKKIEVKCMTYVVYTFMKLQFRKSNCNRAFFELLKIYSYSHQNRVPSQECMIQQIKNCQKIKTQLRNYDGLSDNRIKNITVLFFLYPSSFKINFPTNISYIKSVCYLISHFWHTSC